MPLFSPNILPIDELEIAVVSDIHIASGDRNDYEYKRHYPISGEAKTLEKFCRLIELAQQCSTVGRYIVILGDTLNGECGYWSAIKTQAFTRLKSALKPWFDNRHAFIVLGNHDIEAKRYLPAAGIDPECVVPNTTFLNIGGLIFMHGNQFDWRCNGKRPWGMLGDIASRAATTLLPPAIEDLIRGREYEFCKDSSNRPRDIRFGIPSTATLAEMKTENFNVASGALEFLESVGTAHTIMCGHTHQTPIQIEHHPLRYINAGKFAKDGIVNVRVRISPDSPAMCGIGRTDIKGEFVPYNKWRPTLS